MQTQDFQSTGAPQIVLLNTTAGEPFQPQGIRPEFLKLFAELAKQSEENMRMAKEIANKPWWRFLPLFKD